MPRPRCNAWQTDHAPAGRNVVISNIMLHVHKLIIHQSINQLINMFNVLEANWDPTPNRSVQ